MPEACRLSLLSSQDFDKKVKVKYTKVGIGINVYITNSSSLPIPDCQSKMLQGGFGDFKLLWIGSVIAVIASWKTKVNAVSSDVIQCASLRSKFWSCEIGGSEKTAVLWVCPQFSWFQRFPRKGIFQTFLPSSHPSSLQPPNNKRYVWSQRLAICHYDTQQTRLWQKGKGQIYLGWDWNWCLHNQFIPSPNPWLAI